MVKKYALGNTIKEIQLVPNFDVLNHQFIAPITSSHFNYYKKKANFEAKAISK